MSKDLRFIRADLVVSEYDVPHDEITRTLGVEPTRTFTKGDIIRHDPKGLNKPLRHKQNLWATNLVKPNKGYLEENISQAIDAIAHIQEGVKSLSSKHYVELSISGSSSNETRQAFHIDRDLASKLLEYGIELDVDIYPMEEEVFDTEQKKRQMHDRLAGLGFFADAPEDEVGAVVDFYAELEKQGQFIIDELSDFAWFYDVRTPEESNEYLAAIIKRTKKLHQLSSRSSLLSESDEIAKR